MREIKFRAWDKVQLRFMYVTLHPTQIGWATPHWISQGLLRGQDDYVRGIEFSGIEGWQQYTGLKDKNGVEIYEGDIIRETCQDFPKGHYCAEWIVEDLPEFYGHRFDPCVGFGCNNVEVIGNIYENPELLKG